jgi:hypothetical protein
MNIPGRRWPILAAAAVVVLLASGTATACAPAPDRKPVALTLDDAPATVEGDSTTITGRTTPGARVEVAGQTAIVEGDRFEHSVAVEVGENRILVVATKNGLEVARDEVTVRRAQPVAPAGGSGPTSCPSDEVLTMNQGVRSCVPPVASPEDCGPGMVPVPDPPAASPGICTPGEDGGWSSVPPGGIGPTSCPPGEVIDSNQGVRNCVSPVSSPEDCGPGMVPVPDPPYGSPGLCTPRD